MSLILLKIEVLKIRRSLALLMMAACPMIVVLLNTGMLIKSGALAAGKAGLWTGFWMGNLALWCYFMLPLYIALITALLNGNEHKNSTWRLMLTLPISPHQLFFFKVVLAVLFVAGANLCLMLFSMAVLGLFGLLGYSLQSAFAFPIAWSLLKILLACLPVVIIQHTLSWRCPNIVIPLAVGVCATMGILQIGSSSYWPYFPWSYTLMAANGSEVPMQMQAIALALLLGLLLFALSSYWLGNRESPD